MTSVPRFSGAVVTLALTLAIMAAGGTATAAPLSAPAMPPAPTGPGIDALVAMNTRTAAYITASAETHRLVNTEDRLSHAESRIASDVALAHAIGYRMPAAVGGTDASPTRLQQSVALVNKITDLYHLDPSDQWWCSNPANPCSVPDWPIIAAQTMEAALLLWDVPAPAEVSPLDKGGIERLAEDFVLRNTGTRGPDQLRYYRTLTSAVTRPGDSAAEEMAWFERAFSAASLVVPDSPHITHIYRMRAVYGAHSFATVADYANTGGAALHNGHPICRWLKGSNLQADGSIVNHGKIHPGYARAPHNYSSWAMTSIAGQPASTLTLRGTSRLFASNLRFRYTLDGRVRFPRGNPDPPYTRTVPGGPGEFTNAIETHFLAVHPQAVNFIAGFQARTRARQSSAGDFGPFFITADTYAKFSRAFLNSGVAQHQPPARFTRSLSVPSSGTAC
jgi:hypothetical protein